MRESIVLPIFTLQLCTLLHICVRIHGLWIDRLYKHCTILLSCVLLAGQHAVMPGVQMADAILPKLMQVQAWIQMQAFYND